MAFIASPAEFFIIAALIVVVHLACAVATAFIAKKKGYTVWVFVLTAVLTSAVTSLILMACLPRAKGEQ